MQQILQQKTQQSFLYGACILLVTLSCPGSIDAGRALKKTAIAAAGGPQHDDQYYHVPVEEEPLIDQIAMESIDTLSPPTQSHPNGFVSVLPPPKGYTGFKINPNCKCGISPFVKDDKEGNAHPWTAAIFYDNPPTSQEQSKQQAQIPAQSSSASSSRLLFCTGSLINDRYVISAARCVQGLNATDLHVWLSEKEMWSDQKIRTGRLGQHEYDGDSYLTKIPVEEIIIHPDFSPSRLNHEVALLKLSKPVHLSRRKRSDDVYFATQSEGNRKTKFFPTPICLPKHDVMEIMRNEDEPESSYIEGLKGTVVSWDKKGRTSYSLVQAQVPFVNGIDKCVEMTNYTAVLADTMFCAGKMVNGVASDSCSMDTGSPLVIYEEEGTQTSHEKDEKGRFSLVGVSTWLYGCTNLQNVNVIYDVIFPDNTAKPQVPGVYANVQKYRDWITHNTLDAVWCA